MKFIFTCGDINGIGPEIVIKAINRIVNEFNDKIFFIIPEKVFLSTINYVPPKFNYEILDYKFASAGSSDKKTVTILKMGYSKIIHGRPTITSGMISFYVLRHAFELIKYHLADAIITAPISKTAFKLAGVKYEGHTELFADMCKTKNYAMMFLSKKMKVALITIHKPINSVSKLMNQKILKEKFEIILNALINDLRIYNPRIAVLGLNPHSGENGFIGKEEIDIINPVIKKFKNNFYGCFSADAFFANKEYKNYDCVVGMYHDQVLIPFKMLNMNVGVNFTAGLPIIRTSPDHGVAYDIAGKNIANEDSIFNAFLYAREIAMNRIII